jgi:3'-phosphoadenosine 5'-phosphosulfate sulfotransferase (PAPS reductase)/FAD synthetase
MSRLQSELLSVARPTPEQVVAAALTHNPVAIFALLSGGDDSMTSAHWMMNNVPGCEIAHIVTGIGIKRTRLHVRDVCARYGWRLTEVRAKEDCGQDYEKIVLEHGFPGPGSHRFMYVRLKERAIEKLVRDRKTKRSDKVMLATGIRQDESQRRTGYGGQEITFKGAQMWVNPMYWVTQTEMHHYRVEHQVRRNPVSEELGMSGECLCGAFAAPGELELIRRVCPDTAARIEAIQERARIAGKHCVWGTRPPRARADTATPDLFAPMCVSCGKSERLAA